MLAKTETILEDLKKYYFYVLPKSRYDYAQTPNPSSNFDILIPSKQFAEVAAILTKVFRERKFSLEHSSRLTHDMLEIIEETRSQCADVEISMLTRGDLSPEKMVYWLKQKKVLADVMPSKAILADKGLDYRLWIRFDMDEDVASVYSKIVINEDVFQDEVEDLVERYNEKNTFIQFKLVKDAGPQFITDVHDLPIKNGIPIRLMMRYLKRFSQDFGDVFMVDKDKVLKRPTT